MLTIVEAARALRAGELSSVDLLRAGIKRADAVDEALGVYLARYDEQALEAAQAADDAFAAGDDKGPLQGIPIGVKDIIYTREGPTTGNSLVKNPAWEIRRDAQVVARLRDAGAVITGKLSTMEFALGAVDYEGPFRMPRTPWNADCWAGGSSSGSGAGVAAGLFLGALGTDTAGSIRLPAAYCGVTGLKPTFGRVSLDGVIPLSSAFDCVGPLTRSAADAALMLQVLAGHRPEDPTTLDVPTPAFDAQLGMPVEGLRVGVARAHHLDHPDLDPGVGTAFEAALAELEAQGASLSDVTVPFYDQVLTANLIGFMSDALAYHHKLLREQWDSYQRTTRVAFASGALFTAGDYARALKVRRAVRRQVNRLFDDVDVIVCPTTATPAPEADSKLVVGRIMNSIFTPYWAVMGSPTISIPMGFSTGLPVGLQISGRAFDEQTVLRVADAYQRATDWHRRVPPMVASKGEEAGRV